MTIQIGFGDQVEQQYQLGIESAAKAGDNHKAHQLSIGLSQYRANRQARQRERRREPPGIELHAGNSG